MAEAQAPILHERDWRRPGVLAAFAFLGALVLVGLGAAWHMEHNGHWVTGMTNQVVWGMPHVFAVFLIVAASGALNVASMGSVFGRTLYKPLAPLSTLLALALLAGGLAVLVLDLGRPDRLAVAMLHYNFKSIFAWNIFLYTGFFALGLWYLWWQMDRNRFARSGRLGLAAFLWRLVLTTGTGSIFGFLAAREAYNAAILAPLFIALSLAFGTAFFLLVLMASVRRANQEVYDRLRPLLGLFVAVALYFVAVHHLTNLYMAGREGVERFLLIEGGVYPWLFWLGAVGLGGVLPLLLLFHPAFARRGHLALASALVLLGGLAQIYVIIIGGQAYPLNLFPGMTVTSSFGDGQVAAYAPSAPEFLLGLGGVALALAIVLAGQAVLRLLPPSEPKS